MKYSWDENKRRANLARHEVDFIEVENFEWDTALISADLREDYGEDRWRAIGFIGVRLYVLIHTERGETVRVISLRKTTKTEEKLYAQET